MGMLNLFKQSIFIPKPTLTEDNLPDQKGKVHIVTGGYAGVGFQLVRILYQRHATVYVAGRNREKADVAIAAIRAEFPASKGRVEFLSVDLADLATIKPAVAEFTARESELHVLTNNAGVMWPPQGSKDAHGRELQLATNVIGPYLFAELLAPVLVKTAKSAPEGSVRMTWAGSIAVDLGSPKGGVSFDEEGVPVPFWDDEMQAYGQTKAANALLAVEFAERYGKDGVLSFSWNPGNLKTELQRHVTGLKSVAINSILYPPIFGAYTELYAGWSPELTAAQSGAYIAPWGRVFPVRDDIKQAAKNEVDGGTGQRQQLVGYLQKVTKEYV